MDNNKSSKVHKKRKNSNNSVCRSSSHQKENVPKNEKPRTTIKPNPNDGIAMSKQLLKKKKNSRTSRTVRRSSSKPERVCPNGKPIPSLSELEKMFEDSDDDNQTPKSPTLKSIYTPSTPEKQPVNKNEKLLFSPTTINKITEQLKRSIEKQNLPHPSEVLEATSLLREKSPPPAPIIPPKKRKKPDVPYIVGCKDRPKVIKKPNTNFCKGDEDYGVEASGEDPEDQIPKKRAKKSRIPNYTKSIFNAQSDEIAERLIKDDTGGLSDASSDSNKTIEYDPTPFQNPRLRSFSPLPSTSKDNETIKKNDELFNESLMEISLIKASTPIKKLHVQITPESTPKAKEDNAEKTNKTTPKKKDDLQPLKTEDDLQIIDTPYDTIVIDDMCERPVNMQNTSNAIEDASIIEILEPVGLEVIKPKKNMIDEIPNDDDCMIITSSATTNNLMDLVEPIVIDDEYSSINMDFDSFNNETIEIIDVDDVIAENKSILDKWKTSGAKELNKINTVVDVPTTYRNLTTQNTVTPNTIQAPQDMEVPRIHSPAVTPCPRVEITPSTSPDPNNSLNMTNRNSATNIQNNPRQVSSVMDSQRNATFQSILNDFFAETRQNRPPTALEVGIATLFDTLIRETPTNRRNRIPSQPVNTATPISTNTSQKDLDTRSSSSNFVTPQTNTTAIVPPSPVPTRNIGDCPICLDPLHSSNGIASTICGHVFCLKCIQASVRTNGKKCPTCRKPLKGAGGGYHQLYL